MWRPNLTILELLKEANNKVGFGISPKFWKWDLFFFLLERYTYTYCWHGDFSRQVLSHILTNTKSFLQGIPKILHWQGRPNSRMLQIDKTNILPNLELCIGIFPARWSMCSISPLANSLVCRLLLKLHILVHFWAFSWV